ncbi:hypothetical protein OK074_6550 [Actinobacteria bacterium OK074]|nr:hypothetical protein OK074_6550 [Actinobacteria bacterium OK074]
MTRRHGCALIGALSALILTLSAAIYVGAGLGDGKDSRSFADSDAGTAQRNQAAPASTGTWVGAWAAAPVGGEPGTEEKGMAGHSVRNVVHTVTSGTSARVTLSNLYGQAPLTITSATVATAAATDGAAARSGTMRRLTFNGATSVVIPAGKAVVSDAVRISIAYDSDVLITTYSPTASGPVTYHPMARQTSYAAEGDHTQDLSAASYTEETAYWRYVTALDVMSNDSDGTVVAFGDSLTDGRTATVGENHRWTDFLAERLRTAVASGQNLPRYTVVNEGISGNRVLTNGLGRPAENASGLSRFERDVLGQTNAKVVVIDLGVNDILHPTTGTEGDPTAIVAGLRKLVREAHAHGLKVIGATLMPFGGHYEYSAERESVREAINTEIRSGKVFDSVVDFDAALRDPSDALRLRPSFDSGDHLHPNDAGFRAMAEAFSLKSLKGSAAAKL